MAPLAAWKREVGRNLKLNLTHDQAANLDVQFLVIPWVSPASQCIEDGGVKQQAAKHTGVVQATDPLPSLIRKKNLHIGPEIYFICLMNPI